MAILNNPMAALAAVNVRAGVAVASGAAVVSKQSTLDGGQATMTSGLSRWDGYLWRIGNLLGADCLFGDIRGQAAMDCYMYCRSRGYGRGSCLASDAQCNCQVCQCHAGPGPDAPGPGGPGEDGPVVVV